MGGEAAPMTHDQGPDPVVPPWAAQAPPGRPAATTAWTSPDTAPPPAAPAWVSPDTAPTPEPAAGRSAATGVGPSRATFAGPGSPGAVPAGLDPRAGGIPLRPLSVGELLDGTFTTIRRNPRATLGLSALLVTVQQLIVVGAEVATNDLPTASGVAADGLTVQVVGGLGALVGLVLSAVVGAILTGMIVVVVAEDVLGRTTSIGEVWRRVRPRLWALLGAAVLAGVLPFLGLAFLIAPGVILWGAWALTTPALILERLGPIRALRRSWRLAWPSFWRVWGIRSLSVILGWIIQNLVLVPIALLGLLVAALLGADDGDDLPLAALAIVTMGAILGGTVAEPFLAGVVALLYLDRRMRAEGLDIVLGQQVRTARRHPTAPGPSVLPPAPGTARDPDTLAGAPAAGARR